MQKSRFGWKQLLLAAWAIASCSAPSDYDRFKQAVDSGADCQELFDIRNQVDPQSPDIRRINAHLQEVGCYSAGSKRAK